MILENTKKKHFLSTGIKNAKLFIVFKVKTKSLSQFFKYTYKTILVCKYVNIYKRQILKLNKIT